MLAGQRLAQPDYLSGLIKVWRWKTSSAKPMAFEAGITRSRLVAGPPGRRRAARQLPAASEAAAAEFRIAVRPADVLAEVGGKRIKHAPGAHFVAHRLQLAGILLECTEKVRGDRGHDLSP